MTNMRREAAFRTVEDVCRPRSKATLSGGRSMLTLWPIKRRAMIEVRKGR